MKISSYAIAALMVGAAFLVGCGKSEIGDAPVVKVSAEQRAKDVNEKADATLKWLEGLAPADRQSAIARAPQISAALKEATDPAIKARIEALGLKL